MANLKDEHEARRSVLGALAPWKRVTFATACAERMFAAYERYRIETGWGDSGPIRAAVDRSWDVALGRHDGTEDPTLSEACLRVVPDEEVDDWNDWIRLGQDAAVIAICALDTATTGDETRAEGAAGECLEAVRLSAEMRLGLDTYGPEDELRLQEDEFVQAEMARQARDLADLEAAQDHDVPLIEQIRQRSRIDTQTLLGL